MERKLTDNKDFSLDVFNVQIHQSLINHLPPVRQLQELLRVQALQLFHLLCHGSNPGVDLLHEQRYERALVLVAAAPDERIEGNRSALQRLQIARGRRQDARTARLYERRRDVAKN